MCSNYLKQNVLAILGDGLEPRAPAAGALLSELQHHPPPSYTRAASQRAKCHSLGREGPSSPVPALQMPCCPLNLCATLLLEHCPGTPVWSSPRNQVPQPGGVILQACRDPPGIIPQVLVQLSELFPKSCRMLFMKKKIICKGGLTRCVRIDCSQLGLMGVVLGTRL